MREPVVLIVDDFEDGREMYATYLERGGYRVLQAESGAQALALVERRVPDLIVLDLSMPEMDGWAVIERLRARESTRNVPVILLTGISFLRASASSAGCAGYLTKPCAPEDLAAAVQSVLEHGAMPEHRGG